MHLTKDSIDSHAMKIFATTHGSEKLVSDEDLCPC
jgi:hypothetical protein